MLVNLRVKNVALIDELDIAFARGLNVLSGETGAGKSIIIGAIGFALGGKAGHDFIRAGCASASVEALFDFENKEPLDNLRRNGIETDGGVLLYRSVDGGGKTVCRINGHAVALGMLRDLTAGFVDTHSQHEHQSLLDPSRHIVLLDRLCPDGLEERKSRLSSLYDDYKSIMSLLGGVTEAAKHRGERIAELDSQIREIASAKLTGDEEDELNGRRERAAYAGRLRDKVGRALELLTKNINGGSANAKVGAALSAVGEAAGLDGSLSGLQSRLEEAAAELDDIAYELNEYYENIGGEPGSVDQIEERLALIRSLKRKYGDSVTEILAYAERARAERSELDDSEIRLSELVKQKKSLEREIISVCAEISAIRRETARRVEADVALALKDLGMKHAAFKISIERRGGFTRNGFDRVEFFISPNIGEELRPLANTASGGEMSRVMLALKTVLASADSVETFIFDEIDAGISGKTAQMVAEKLSALALPPRQILCITHLPQIAAMADSHYLIEKITRDGRALTTIAEIGGAAAEAEIARLISGARVTDTSLRASAEMLSLAKTFKNKL